MSQLSDLVQDAKLSTKLDSEFTTHTFLESCSIVGRRSRPRRREERWRRTRYLDIGTFGTTWQEECTTDGSARLRTVRGVRKLVPGRKPIDYSRELEAITKFSQQKFDGCFVKSSGWFEDEETIFICMEDLPLGNLQQHIFGAFPEGETQHITLQLLEGLDFMHCNGFAHRDLKPQNIFVLSNNPEWWIKIGDFGLSKRILQGLTAMQSFNSTPAFTAPELYKAMWVKDPDEQNTSSEVNPEVDIWSLGIITHYLLTGKLLFTGQHDLLAYYESENKSMPPEEILNDDQFSSEALTFLRDTLKPSPSDRLTAKDALDHAWLAPLLQDSEPDEPLTSPSSLTGEVIPPLQPRKPRDPVDVMLPGTINLTVTSTSLAPSTPLTLPSPQSQSVNSTQLSNDMFQQSPLKQQQQQGESVMVANSANGNQIRMQSNIGSLGLSDRTYKQMPNSAAHPPSALNLVSNVHPAHRLAMTSESHPYAQASESHMSDPSLRPAHLRQSSQLSSEMSSEEGIEIPPPYFRRDSDSAPIPASELDEQTTNTESPVDRQASVAESSRGSTERSSSDHRLSDRFRRVSGSMMPKRHHQRSQDHGKKNEKETGAPLSPTSSNSTKASNSKSGSRKKKSQIVEIPGRSQFGEGLPLFPVRVKR